MGSSRCNARPVTVRAGDAGTRTSSLIGACPTCFQMARDSTVDTILQTRENHLVTRVGRRVMRELSRVRDQDAGGLGKNGRHDDAGVGDQPNSAALEALLNAL